MDYVQFSDDFLLQMLRSDDYRALDALYMRYWRQLYHHIIKKVRRAEVAEELVQNIFISVWEKRAGIVIDNVPAYLMTAARYQAIGYIRGIMLAKTKTADLPELPDYDTNQAESNIALHELSAAVEAAVGRLPRKTRTIYQLSRGEHRSIREISTFMNLSEKTVEYHITQSLKLLRTFLKGFILSGGLMLIFQ